MVMSPGYISYGGGGAGFEPVGIGNNSVRLENLLRTSDIGPVFTDSVVVGFQRIVSRVNKMTST